MVTYLANAEVASTLDEIADLLHERGETAYRVSAFRNAALVVRHHPESLAGIYEREGTAGLRKLPAIGDSIARTVGQMFRLGRSQRLARLRRDRGKLDPLTTLPSIGRELAQRIRGQLGIRSLEELMPAVSDGRLRRVPGLGRKRVQAIQDNLARRLPEAIPTPRNRGRVSHPAIADLLDLDRQYRRQVAAGRLPLAAPKQFNPTAARWLPILRTELNGGRYVVHFANTARSHELAREHDWVAIRREDKSTFGWWTVVTARSGPLSGRRVVRGLEHECMAHYARRQIQLELPPASDE